MRLVLLSDGRSVYKLDKYVTRVGFSARCDIVIGDSRITNHHASIIQKSDGRFVLLNHSVTQYLRVNGETARYRRLLVESDVLFFPGSGIRVSSYVFVYAVLNVCDILHLFREIVSG